MSTAFSIEEKQQPGVNFVKISGPVNEFAEFKKVTLSPVVRIDLGASTGLNSVGTRNWCLWIRSFTPPSVVLLENCPMIFVKAFNQVSGALPSNAHVTSFIVPYVSDPTGERNNFLFVKDQHFKESGELNPPTLTDSKGLPMEMDVIPQSYFSFLGRK